MLTSEASRERNDDFTVIYPSSQDAEHAYFNFQELRALRTALILHLQHNTSIDVQTAFFGCWSQEWITFLEGICPYFLIVGQ